MSDTHKFERPPFLNALKQHRHEITFLEARLTESTASLAQGFPCVCVFVNDQLNKNVIQQLAAGGTKLIALRSAGYNQVDLHACKEFGIIAVRVPEYSPYAVAEHAVALILDLNRKIHRAYNRVREGNFSLEGLVGFDLHNKTVGVIGTGRIGTTFAKIMTGFGCRILAYDKKQNSVLEHSGVRYVDLEQLYKLSDIISLHVPLAPETNHLLNKIAFEQMKPNVMIINTGRGRLIDTKALIDALKHGRIGSAGLDVYEEEEGIFFADLSDHILQDDQLARLLTFPNVIITSHQGFLTHEALTNIAETTLLNITEFERGAKLTNQVVL